ncbi:MAG: metallophosphatase family protein [candidate division KSB1 bacterium]|nr:metallophosphatase family protein [candidate division KSB1 bacterium]MDZ7393731.1 metallophosphatase family protein [candidate division KSB1 bacterium]
MRVAIISDVHSNLEALTAVLQTIDDLQVEDVICLGDIVGYGPNPNECIELVRGKASVIIAGNHDFASVGLTDTSYFNTMARVAAEWTGRMLTEEHRQFLCGLQYIYRRGNLFFVHATPEAPEQWYYLETVGDAYRNFEAFSEKICFVGHSHVPVVLSLQAPGEIHVETEPHIALDTELRYMINVGSVGQPRDGNPDACFGVLDTGSWSFELVRVTYAFETTQEKILAAGLPSYLADRLALGQ